MNILIQESAEKCIYFYTDVDNSIKWNKMLKKKKEIEENWRWGSIRCFKKQMVPSHEKNMSETEYGFQTATGARNSFPARDILA